MHVYSNTHAASVIRTSPFLLHVHREKEIKTELCIHAAIDSVVVVIPRSINTKNPKTELCLRRKEGESYKQLAASVNRLLTTSF